MPIKYVPFKELTASDSFPAPILLQDRVLRHNFMRVTDPFLLVPPMDEELKFMTQTMSFDVFFGQNLFMGKSWTIDYPGRKVWVNTPLNRTDQMRPGMESIGFKKNESGEKIFGHPSMQIVVDGDTIDVLFDTGATIILSDNGKKALHTDKKTIAGSFIASSVFDKWRTRHPEWKYFEKTDRSNDVIEVPGITIAGVEAGPVLFARRPDSAWSEGMIGSMDKVVKGAIGGSALKYYRVTIDYNADLIAFER
jgi:hypothetical protein